MCSAEIGFVLRQEPGSGEVGDDGRAFAEGGWKGEDVLDLISEPWFLGRRSRREGEEVGEL